MIKIQLHKTLLSNSKSFELDVDFEIKMGEFIAIYGASGAGKTTILRLIAGLDKDAKGTINIKGVDWLNSQSKINLPPQKRKVGLVFQDYALFPNMTVKENLEFALSKGQSNEIISDLIETIELKDFANRKPSTLSGGQKQRVALARALVQQPDVLLLDEPLSALDDEMRFKLQDFLVKVHKKYNLTTFIVTHDLAEVFKLSTQVIKLSQGKITEIGKAEDLFLDAKISGKYKMIGRILSIKKSDVVNIVSVISGQNIIKIIATDEELIKLKPGHKVAVISKAFNPILKRLSH